jgi:hypothetical protein
MLGASSHGMNEDEQAAEKLVTEAYALVGHVATGFAALEFHLQFLVSFLISGKELSPEAILTTRKQHLAERLDLLKDLTRLRLPAGSDVRTKALELIDDLNALRETRNLHIHGFWLINYPLVAFDKIVRVSDPRWRFNKEDESWHSMGTKDIPIETLRNQTHQIAQLIERIHALIQEIKTTLIRKPDATGDA